MPLILYQTAFRKLIPAEVDQNFLYLESLGQSGPGADHSFAVGPLTAQKTNGDLSALFNASGPTYGAYSTIQNGDGTNSAKYAYTRFKNNDANGQSFIVGHYGSDNFLIRDGKAGADRLAIKPDGNVGIGTASPAQKLHLYNAGSSLYVKLERGTGSLLFGSDSLGGAIFTDTSTTPLYFGINNTEKMRLTTDAFLINTTVNNGSGAKLQVNGDVTTGKLKMLDAGSDTVPALKIYADNVGISSPLGTDLAFLTGGAARLRIDAAGNLGLGVNPTGWTGGFAGHVIELKDGATLQGLNGTPCWLGLAANLYFDGAYRRKALGYVAWYRQNDGEHIWSTAASGAADSVVTHVELARITRGGALLVATDTDNGSGAKFQVNGGVSCTGEIYAAGGVRTVVATPSSSSAAGTAGLMFVDTNYLYVCTATNTWKRVALLTF